MRFLKSKLLILGAITMFSGYVHAQKCDVLSLFSELDRVEPPNTLSNLEKTRGWELLFDGKTFQNWRGYNLDHVPEEWHVDNGIIKIDADGKHESIGIITEKTYKDFALSLEANLTEGANSGLLFQVAEDPKYTFPYETGPEFQIIDHENWHDELEDWQIMGSNYAMYPPAARPYKAPGEWNHLFLVVRDNKVTQLLNGEIVVHYEKYSDDWDKRRNSGKWDGFPDWGKFDEGHITLQNHSTNVWFRNIKIKEL